MENKQKFTVVDCALVIIVLGCFILLLLFNACTVSFHNVMTHGSATDLIDENQKADADVDAALTLPATI